MLSGQVGSGFHVSGYVPDSFLNYEGKDEWNCPFGVFNDKCWEMYDECLS